MRNLKLKSGLAVIATFLIAGTAYGGSDAGGASTANTAGVYSGTSRFYLLPGPKASKPNQIIGAVSQNGTGYFVTVPGESSQIQVIQKLEGTGRVFSAESEVPTEGHKVGRGAQRWIFDVTPDNAHGDAYTLNARINCGDCYTAYNLHTLPLTHKWVTLSKRAGAYRGVDINRLTKVSLTLDSKGHLAGSDDKGCGLSGTLTRVGHLDLFDTSLNVTGGAACHGAMTGVAFFDTRDRTGQVSKAKGSYLYLVGADGDLTHGFAMVLSSGG